MEKQQAIWSSSTIFQCNFASISRVINSRFIRCQTLLADLDRWKEMASSNNASRTSRSPMVVFVMIMLQCTEKFRTGLLRLLHTQRVVRRNRRDKRIHGVDRIKIIRRGNEALDVLTRFGRQVAFQDPEIPAMRAMDSPFHGQ